MGSSAKGNSDAHYLAGGRIRTDLNVASVTGGEELHAILPRPHPAAEALRPHHDRADLWCLPRCDQYTR